ncbi:DUF4429 domain-containing protein [Nocardiopsis ganjiahuensis]|uniref:DUF4429 domain-containing protein n=1 Tax=Nocardiopsis ganjiahuensis TaxID=239984 RepID=UPI000A066E3D|nr:DUF4429 domain-containing protein [Nocardiopsis ganjiahuensis]
MAEVSGREGSWSFDGAAVWLAPGKRAHALCRALGVVSLPLDALVGAVFEPSGRGGVLRVYPRPGADPFTEVTQGTLNTRVDPYALRIGRSGVLVAEYFAETVAAELAAAGPGNDAPADRYLVEPPKVPVHSTVGDASVTFDGSGVYVRPNWKSENAKREDGSGRLSLEEIAEVRWTPATGNRDGSLRFVPVSGERHSDPRYDPYSVHWSLWGKDYWGGTTSVVAAAVAARLPHPSARGLPEKGTPRALPWWKGSTERG